MQLLPELLCSIPTQVHARLEEWWFSRYRYPRVDKNLRVPGPALLVPVEPLGFLGGWILDEALTSHDRDLVHAYQDIAGHINTSMGTCPSL